MNNLMEVKNVVKSFPGVKVLNDVSVSFTSGKIHGIVGENGAGKSTLIKCISGVYQPDEGEITYQGDRIHFTNPRVAIEKGIRVVHQEFSLVPYMTVAENIFLGSFPEKNGFVDKQAMIDRAAEIINDMNIDLDPEKSVEELSVAEQQIVEIIKAFSQESTLLILDEPTAALNSTEVDILFSLMKDIIHKDVGLLFISHRLSEILEICDLVTVMKDGEVIGTYERENLTEDKLVSLMVGRNLSYTFPDHTATKTDDVILEVNQLSSPLLKGEISFKNYRGEILGFYGLEGQGQREVLRILFGLAPMTGGEVILNDKKLDINSPGYAVNQGITYVPPDRKIEGLGLNLSVIENISMPYYLKTDDKLINRGKLGDICQPVIVKFNIKTSSYDTLVRYLSGGNQQKIVIGKWLATDPRILLLDEPTRGIDVDSKMEIYNILRDLVEQGIGVILFTSDLIETMELCDRLIVFCEKTISGELTWQEFTEEKIMSYSTGLKSANQT